MEEVLVKLEGVDEIIKALQGMPAKIRAKAVRAALRKAASVIRDDAKARAPVLRAPAPFRTPGTVRKAISVRNSKFARQAGDEGVFVGVRPAKGAKFQKAQFLGFKYRRKVRDSQRGAKSPVDPFYWRFLEFGTKKLSPRPFLGPAAQAKGEEAIRLFLRESLPAIQKLNRKNA